MTDIVEMAMQARKDASIIIDRHTNPGQKKASLTLYGVLASCLRLCEICENEPDERAKLQKLFDDQPKAGNRRYVEKGSDVYVFVCRFVFTNTDRTNAIRYACALREAGKNQVHSSKLAEFLKENGGVNALYFRRPLDRRTVKTKCLRLAEQIEFSRDEPFTLILTWRSDNTFDVIPVSTPDSSTNGARRPPRS